MGLKEKAQKKKCDILASRKVSDPKSDYDSKAEYFADKDGCPDPEDWD